MASGKCMMVDEPHRPGALGAQRPAGAPDDFAPWSCGRLRGWHVVETHPGKPFTAERALAAAGWDVFHPLHLQPMAGKHADKIVPLFPGYLFVLFGLEDDWPRICRTEAVHRLLGPPGKPSPVPMAAINDLQARTSARRIVDDPLTPGAPPYGPGARLAVRSGPFAGLSGVCAMAAADRIMVMLSMFGRDVPVALAPGAVSRLLEG
jgi:transcription antitermination factor NusG